MLKRDELLFSLIVIVCWEISGFPVLFQPIFIEKIEKSFTCRLGFKFQRKPNFGFCALLLENNKYNISRIFF